MLKKEVGTKRINEEEKKDRLSDNKFSHGDLQKNDYSKD